MIFIYPRKEGREDIGKFAHYLLSTVSITLSKEVSLESIFQVALRYHPYFQTPPTGEQIQVLNTTSSSRDQITRN